ncbi:hypothetical protein CDA63_06285 [Hymenobacter amundsenii]|uniref:Uncharacterized protein n=1 Tax=Hymenobacter amundsenii TaxID=2006685 RepID=A0A246FMV1_9BACT|nr:hypothetical protein [Hymenobacter amundsenii]OWP64068.1 hypothetical protein CDA63_06285 [Hymenobacter amundsenii]
MLYNRYYLLLLMALLSFGSCKKDCGISPAGCATEGPIRMRADNWQGLVKFDSALNAFVVRYAVPGTFDSVYYGVACGLPEALQSEGQKVEFSGNYRDHPGSGQILAAGSKYYALEITSASAR